MFFRNVGKILANYTATPDDNTLHSYRREEIKSNKAFEINYTLSNYSSVITFNELLYLVK
jgi:hypothetical protein